MIQGPRVIKWFILGNRDSRIRIRIQVLKPRPTHFKISQDKNYQLIATKKQFHFFVIGNKIIFAPKSGIK